MAKQRNSWPGTADSAARICEQPTGEHNRAQAKRVDNPLVAVPQVDREHMELHAQGIAFSAAVVAGAPRAELFIRATQLLEDFERHFASEESLMQATSFPGLKAHVKDHRNLIEQMSGLRDDIGSGVIQRCDALAVFVQLWAEQHKAGPDAQFARFLSEEQARGSATTVMSTVH